MTSRLASWWDALGNPVPQVARRAAYDLAVAEGCDPEEAGIVIAIAAREIEHDKPVRAFTVMRTWLGPNETFVIRMLAVLASVREEEEAVKTPLDTLRRLLASLPADHPDRRGVIRAIEVLELEERKAGAT